MKVLVVNGSPKGAYSITLHTALYLEKRHPEHEFRVLHAGQKIKKLEKDFSEAKEGIEWAEAIVFAYPVYTFIAPSQLHRFIELMKEHKMDVNGKYATQITTSKHFYDTTAHRYVQDNCQEMGMRYVRGLSADMDDLPTEKGRQEAENFWQHFCWNVENGYCEPNLQLKVNYTPKPVTPAEENHAGKSGDVVIVADLPDENHQLSSMIERFRAKLPYKTRLVNLRKTSIMGGCLGCFHCATDGKCVYKDGFDEYLRKEIQTAQAMIFAFEIRDHAMGSLFKMYNDREFCNGHRTVTVGMPVGYLVSGAYSAETNLQTIIEGRSQVGGNPLAGVATDEFDPDREIDQLAQKLDFILRTHHSEPQNFYGIGGMKIFRDLIYIMRGMMKADHRFYKAQGHYDFPQKKMGTILKMYLVGALISSPKIRAKMGNSMNEGMIAPYRKVIENMEKK